MHYKSSLRRLVILSLLTTVAAVAMEEREVGQQTEMEHLMPLYGIWFLDLVCSNSRYRSEVGTSRMKCIREVRHVLPHCNGEYRTKIPRNDSKTIGERLRYRDFMAGYTSCLKKRHREWRNAKERL